jgi:hypothetical protein
VIDLGTRRSVRWVEAEWTTGAAPAAHVEFSEDGAHYRRAGTLAGNGHIRRLTRTGSARYIAVGVRGTPQTHAQVVRLSVG